MEYRRIDGLPNDVSVVGLDVGAVLLDQPQGGSRAVPVLVREALRARMNLFDVADAPDPGVALSAIDAGAGDHPIAVVIPESIARADRSVLRPPTGSRSWVVLTDSSAVPNRPPLPPSIHGRRYPGSDPDALTGERLRNDGIKVLRAAGNALDPAALLSAEAAIGSAPVSILVADPHARGLLDGRWLEGPSAGPARPTPPEPWPKLRDRLEPVARLAPLTSGRGRTLAQSAVQFALSQPHVASVLIAPTTPSSVAVFARPESWPRFTEADRERVLARSGEGRAGVRLL